MKRVETHFEEDRGLDFIYVLFRASEKDGTVKDMMQSIEDMNIGKVQVRDLEGRTHVLLEKEIIHIVTDDKRLRIITASGEYMTREPMMELEKRLSKNRFLKISRSEIINLGRVKCYDFSMQGNLKIVFEDGEETWASRRFIPLIRNILLERGDK